MKKYLFKYKATLFCTVMVIVISSVCSVLLAFVLKNILDLLSTRASYDIFYTTVIYSGLFILITSLLTLLKRWFKASYIQKIIVGLKDATFTNITEMDIPKFNHKNSGYYVANLTNDIKLIEGGYVNNVLEIFDDVVSLFIAILALINLNLYLALVTIITSFIPLCIPKFTSKKIALLKQNYSNSIERFTAQIKDVFAGFEVIKSFNLHHQLSDQFNEKSIHVEQAKYQSAAYESGVDSLSTFLSFGVQVTTIVVGVYLARKGLITIGTIVAAGQLMNYIVSPVMQITARINSIQSSGPIIKKLENLAIPETDDAKKIEKKDFHQKIEFSRVSFSYDGKVAVLRDINLTIERGKKYAVVGHSGSGKSTLLKLLLNYYTGYSGEIRMDGTDILEINPDSLFTLISMIHQNVFLFDTTILENIALYQPYEELQMKQAIERSGLSGFIHSLADQENTSIGEAGSKLSGGEKQRIAIARALVRNTPILLLDEATAALDNALAYSIEKSILELSEITALVVTHKLSPELLSQYDHILVLRNGEIVEQGSFQSLLEQKRYFYSLYTYQEFCEGERQIAAVSSDRQISPKEESVYNVLSGFECL